MNVLVIRFSSIGDVALTIPAVKGALAQNSDLHITFLSKSFFAPLFQNIERLHFEGIDLKQYQGLKGLIRLASEIKNKYEHFDVILDLHDSLRSKILRSIFLLNGSKVKIINKGRAEKRLLTRRNNKKLHPLKHHTERYADVFRSSGIQINIPTNSDQLIHLSIENSTIADEYLLSLGGKIYIGIAPFTTSALKEWPKNKISALIHEILDTNPALSILIFGSRDDISKIQDFLDINSARVFSAIGIKGGLSTELSIIKRLKLMIAMDSGNMHLATMLGTKVKAVFGPTHPFLGFAPFLQEQNVIQLEHLECRPCTVFGNTTCWRKDHACMENLKISVTDLER
jgi:ADP-heptose:LPS heptosyltransferase